MPQRPRARNRHSRRAAQSGPWAWCFQLPVPRPAKPKRWLSTVADLRRKTGLPPPAADFCCLANLLAPLSGSAPITKYRANSKDSLRQEMNQAIAQAVPGRYWHPLDDRRIQCDLCPRCCKLHEGQRGLCFVRARENNGMVLTTYGRSSGFCVDPIEKKPLNHFLPGTPVLSFGTAGCNLTCKFCQNWDISKARVLDRVQDHASAEAIAEAAARSGCRSVAFTYNDPVIFLEYAVDVAAACRARGIKTVAVSAGYISPEPRVEFFRHMDAANIDLKGFTEGFYRNLCSGKLASVLETLEYLKRETSVWFEITTLLIRGENDSAAEIEAQSVWVMDRLGPDVPLHFTAFHPDWKLTDRPPTPPQTLRMARRIA